MGLYSELRKLWKKPKEIYKPRVRGVKESFVRLDKPTRLDRARSLGYKAKQGFVIVNAKIRKGGRKRPRPRKARKPGKMGIYYTPKNSLQAIAERRVARKYPNTEVLNSYYSGETGTHKFYEVILVDRDHAVIKKDKNISWITTQRKRAFRGLTAQGKRGKKGKTTKRTSKRKISRYSNA
jgi:large subunit ribosomal protein L15e